MQYSKYHMNNYRIHIIKTDKFKTVLMKINFKRKIEEHEITIRRLLSYVLLNSSKNYQTERELNIKIEDLYNTGINSTVTRSGKYSILSFMINMLNEKYTEENMLENSIAFLKELIFNPNVDNGAFNQKSFDLMKKALKEEIESFKDNPKTYSKKRLYQETAPDTIISYNYRGNLEDLEEITPESLYDYYKSVIENDILDIFIIGEVEEEQIKTIISNAIPNFERESVSEKHYLDYLPPKEENEVEEVGDYNQSNLAISLRFDKLTDFESQYVLQIFNFIFGGGSESKLFKEVREKNSLCYSIGASSLLLDRLIVVSAGIEAKSSKLAINLIKQCLQDMKDGKFATDDIKKAKTTYINGCKEMMDSPQSIINNYISKEYLGLDLIEDKMKKIKKVTKKMVVELACKIEIDTIYLLKGGITNEEDTTN